VGSVSTIIAPVVPSTGTLRPLGLDRVRITGGRLTSERGTSEAEAHAGHGFWAELQARNAAAMIPHAREWVERVGWVDNLRRAAAGTLADGHRGPEFADSDVYKLIEAMAWETARTGDAELDSTVDELVAVVAAAQEPDGYLHTRFGRPGQPPRYSDLEWGHELYCYGHLIQAAVARLRSRGEDTLSRVALRVADHVCREFGPSGRAAVCGHPEIEMALVELYRATGERRYLDQARLFVDRRGQGTLADIPFGRGYYQDDVPVRARNAFGGHAVRALYLACGAVDVAVETGDDKLLDAITRQWERTVAARTYLTGGMGARHEGEAFGQDYELPPDGAYAETCAGVASTMLAWRLLLATGEARFADLAERTLYNVVAAAPARDGRAFFYANPLHLRVPGDPPRPDAPSPRAASTLRAPWFAVACCPTNVARTLATLGGVLATADPHGVQVHQYATASVTADVAGREVTLHVETAYPWDGRVRISADRDLGPVRLALRVPSWAHAARLDGATVTAPTGYATVERVWRAGDEIRLDLPVAPARFTYPDPRLDAVRGCVAVERGPLVYCAEGIDLPDGVTLDALAVDAATPPAHGAEDTLGPDTVALTVRARTTDLDAATWPYRRRPAATGAGAEVSMRLIPYHRWANRGPTAMRVWLPARTPPAADTT
jgi:uncharacterized protein